MSSNQYGLDNDYFERKIAILHRDGLRNWRPDELARELARMSRTADKSVMHETEFAAPVDERQPVAWGTMQPDWPDHHRTLITDKSQVEAYNRQCYELTAFYTAPPELDELQATIARLTAENEQLRSSDEEATELCDTLSSLLGQIAVAVRGPEESKSRHGFGDLPSRVKTVVAEIERLKGGQGEPVVWLSERRGCNYFELVASDEDVTNTGFWSEPFPVYRSQPAPVSAEVVELLRDCRHEFGVDNTTLIERIDACLDKVKEMNR